MILFRTAEDSRHRQLVWKCSYEIIWQSRYRFPLHWTSNASTCFASLHRSIFRSACSALVEPSDILRPFIVPAGMTRSGTRELNSFRRREQPWHRWYNPFTTSCTIPSPDIMTMPSNVSSSGSAAAIAYACPLRCVLRNTNSMFVFDNIGFTMLSHIVRALPPPPKGFAEKGQ